MSVIRVLFYTDYDEMTDSSCSEFGLSELKRLIVYKTSTLCSVLTVQIRSINRHRDLITGALVKGANKLTKDLLDQFDELWVFGFLQTNTVETQENELGNDEVFQLRQWMDAGGGVFVTGDHSNKDPRLDLDDPRNGDPRSFLNLGRALGHRIPRAGQLRVWEGPPTALIQSELEKRDNVNTLVGQEGEDLDLAGHLQSDNAAQELILSERSKVHRLFWWYLDKKGIVPIRKFPDHMHEGKVQVPLLLDGDWTSPKPLPEVVASGRDKRRFIKERVYPLVIAYDGSIIPKETARVGRIVADSSFHHYVNTNLLGFKRDPCGNPLSLSDLDQIAQYFANLTLWLAPQKLRDLLKAKLIILLAAHPKVLEIRGNDINILGTTALAVLNQSVGLANLHQFFEFSPFDSKPRLIDVFLSALFLGKAGHCEMTEKEQIEVLGLVIDGFHRTVDLEQLLDTKNLLERFQPLSVLEAQLSSIFGASTNSISRYLERGEEGIAALLRACELTETPSD